MRGLWFSALALALAAPVAAQDAPVWRAVDAETGQIADLAGLEQLAKDFPESGSVRLRLLNAQLTQGDTGAIVESLAWLNVRGHLFSDAAQAQIRQILGEDYTLAANELLLPRAKVIEASEVIAIVPAEAGLIESAFVPAQDPDGFLIVTSVSKHALWMTDHLEWKRFDLPGANDLSGIVSDDEANVGWTASANLDESEDTVGLFTGLIPLASADDLSPVPAPDGVTVSDLAIGPDGTVYASDPLNGGVYRKPRGADTLTAVLEPGTLRSPQGIAVSPDGQRIYVSDYRYGIAMVDVESGKVSRLSSDVPVILDGTDGLWLNKGELVGMQNGTSPMRISAFKLSDDGSRVVGVRVLEQAHSGWTEPLGGSIAGDALVYVATGQWDRYEKGKLKDGMEAIPTEIRRLPLSR